MKKFLLMMVVVFATTSHAVETVENLDLQRYIGLWNQVGAIPQDFAENCVRNTTAEYAVLENGLIEVKNSCTQADGEVSVAMGRARINDEFNDPARLEVTFVQIAGTWIFALSGDYWVIGLDEDYQWALVGHPELNGLYILARDNQLDHETLKMMRDKIESVGYDSCDVIMSRTPANQFQGNERFCDLEL
jgi:apolipoprotein D and lipocalin family protein